MRIKSAVTLIGLFILSFIFFYFSTGVSFKNLFTKTKEPIPPSEFNGWIAWWDEGSALESLNKNPTVFRSVSPVWYKINEHGTIEKIPNNLENQLTSAFKQQNTKLIPTITNDFDSRRTALVLNNSDIYADLIESLKTLAINSEYQGFDIDWEEIDPNDQPAFTFFIQKLADTMHKNNLLLFVSVHPQTGKITDRIVAKGYKFKELSESVDGLKIMAYDFHNQNSKPGAITPFAELTDVLDYTSSLIPSKKIILGLPTYGYDWEKDSKKTAEVVSFKQASERIKMHNGQTQRDPNSNALIGNYTINRQEHIVWFEDAETLGKMVTLARSYGVYQFSFWRIGAEDQNLWLKL